MHMGRGESGTCCVTQFCVLKAKTVYGRLISFLKTEIVQVLLGSE